MLIPCIMHRWTWKIGLEGRAVVHGPSWEKVFRVTIGQVLLSSGVWGISLSAAWSIVLKGISLRGDEGIVSQASQRDFLPILETLVGLPWVWFSACIAGRLYDAVETRITTALLTGPRRGRMQVRDTVHWGSPVVFPLYAKSMTFLPSKFLSPFDCYQCFSG